MNWTEAVAAMKRGKHVHRAGEQKRELITPAVFGPVERMVRPRTCATCAHRNGGMTWARCSLSGYFAETERKYPAVCGRDFKGWVQRESLLRRLQAWLYAA